MRIQPFYFSFVAAAELTQRQRVSPLPDRLVVQERTPPSATFEILEFALNSRNFAGLQATIEERANPFSEQYAQWLSDDEVTDFVSASEEAIEKTKAWIRSVGLEPQLNLHRDFLTVRDAPAEKVEQLLSSPLYRHYDTVTGQTVHRIPGSYSIPSDVAPHVSKIFPVHSVPVQRFNVSARDDGNSDAAGKWPLDCKDIKSSNRITPGVTRARYNYTSECSLQSSVAALLPGPVGVDQSAIAYIQSNCGLPNTPLDKIVGKNAEAACSGLRPNEDECMEAAIDTQIISTTATNCHTEFWNAGLGNFVSMFKAINDAGDAAPRVFSFSFGDPEPARDDDIEHTEKEFAKSVAKGITLVASSGDNGGGKTILGKYHPNYPGSSSYILSVGSTDPKIAGNIASGEVAVKAGFSSGGFSSIFSVPEWQATYTKAYLDSGAKRPKTGFSATGRGVPDISSYGDNWALRFGKGKWDVAGGTSASSPLIASLVAKLNAARLANGQGTMGFMNPWLYSNAAAVSNPIFDVVEGYNTKGMSDDTPCFYATEGWDAVTGLGTPNYGLLEQLALQKTPAEVIV